MKKFLTMAAIVLSVIILQMPQADAQKVYVGMDDYGDAEIYILTETIRDVSFSSGGFNYSGFSVQVVSSDGNSPSKPWNFFYVNGKWCFALEPKSPYIPVPVTGIILKVAQTANRYR